MYKGDAGKTHRGFSGFKSVYKASLEVDDSRKSNLTQQEIDVCKTVKDVASLLLRKALQIKQIAGLDVCVIELVPEWEHLFVRQELDLRDYIKVCFWKERIPTQIITSKAIQLNGTRYLIISLLGYMLLPVVGRGD